MPDSSCTAIIVHPEEGAAEDEPERLQVPPSSNWTARSTTAGGYTRAYRGLSNQGATCYLNSLLQSLYMTPEFRRAIFQWRYDRDKDGPEDECIPFQLQNLFGRMQISKRGALDTEALTKSFGWGNAEAFQQQDVQELCRVLFDCLEDAFKGTDNASLVNDLYQGDMVDYLKTIGYDYQSNRKTQFLDVSLQVKTFGSDVAMNSVAESLESFLKPEKLEGDEQLHVEQANAKYDAIKGFRFERLPYILTLQLKRFDLDYTSPTLARIKLNDQVRFPLILNMNPYVSSGDDGPSASNKFERSMSEERSRLMGLSQDGQEDEKQKEDPGPPLPDLVDAAGNKAPDQVKEEEVHYPEDDPVDVEEVLAKEGPWVYELYAVLIHSGSALGGHYYAYIKNLADGKWFNFNDSTVSEIQPSQVRSAWGAAATSKNGSSSSTGYGANAYMLLYRKIDRERNKQPPTDNEVPEYILEAAEAEAAKAQREAEEQERLNNQLQLRMLFDGNEKTIYISKHETLRALKKQTAEAFGLSVIDPQDKGEGEDEGKHDDGKDEGEGQDGATATGDSKGTVDAANAPPLTEVTGDDAPVPAPDASEEPEATAPAKVVHLDDLRVREFNMQYKMPRKPYEPVQEACSLYELRFYDYKTTGLEMRESGEDWEEFDETAVVLKMAWYNECTNELDEPQPISVPKDATVGQLRATVSSKMKLPESEILLFKLLHGSLQPRAEFFVDDSKRLQKDLYLYGTQTFYAERKLPVAEEGGNQPCRGFDVYQNSMNKITLKYTLIGDTKCDQSLFADKRWTMTKLRQELSKRLGLETEEQQRNFRIRKQLQQGSELKMSDTRTLKDEALFNDCRLFLLEGPPPSFGEYYWKFFIYRPHDLVLGLVGQLDPETKTCHNEPLMAPDGAARKAKAAQKAKEEALAAAAAAETKDEANTPTENKEGEDGGDRTGNPAAEAGGEGGGASAVPAGTNPAAAHAQAAAGDGAAEGGVGNGDAQPDGGAEAAAGADADGGGGGGGGAAAEAEDDGPPPLEGEEEEIEWAHMQVTPAPSAEDFETDPLQVVVFDQLMIERLRSMIHTQLLVNGTITDDVDVTRIRLREKLSNRCTRILRDGQTLKQAMTNVYDNREIAVQVMPEPEDLNKTNASNGHAVIIRRWHRASWRLSPKQEMYLPLDEPLKTLNRRISLITGIDEQDVRVLKVAVYSPLKLSELNGQRWQAFHNDGRAVSTSQMHFLDGDTLVVHDASEPVRELTAAEKTAIHNAKHKHKPLSTGYLSGSHGTYPPSSSSSSSVSRTTYSKPKEAGIKIKTRHDRELEHQRQKEQEQNEKKAAAGEADAGDIEAGTGGAEGSTRQGTPLGAAVASTVDAGAEADTEDWYDADPLSQPGSQATTDAEVRAMFGDGNADMLD